MFNQPDKTPVQIGTLPPAPEPVQEPIEEAELFYQEVREEVAMIDASARRAQALTVIQQAEAEKRAQRENDPDKRIAEAQAELARLNAQQRQRDLAADVQSNEQYVQANQREIETLIQQLNKIARDIDPITKGPFAVDATYQQQQAFVSHALGRYNQSGGTAEHMAQINSPDFSIQEAARNQARLEYLAAEAKFRDGAPLWVGLAKWIHESATPAERQLRTGIAYIYVGSVIDVPENWNYEAEKNRISADVRRRFSRG